MGLSTVFLLLYSFVSLYLVTSKLYSFDERNTTHNHSREYLATSGTGRHPTNVRQRYLVDVENVGGAPKERTERRRRSFNNAHYCLPDSVRLITDRSITRADRTLTVHLVENGPFTVNVKLNLHDTSFFFGGPDKVELSASCSQLQICPSFGWYNMPVWQSILVEAYNLRGYWKLAISNKYKAHLRIFTVSSQRVSKNKFVSLTVRMTGGVDRMYIGEAEHDCDRYYPKPSTLPTTTSTTTTASTRTTASSTTSTASTTLTTTTQPSSTMQVLPSAGTSTTIQMEPLLKSTMQGPSTTITVGNTTSNSVNSEKTNSTTQDFQEHTTQIYPDNEVGAIKPFNDDGMQTLNTLHTINVSAEAVPSPNHTDIMPAKNGMYLTDNQIENQLLNKTNLLNSTADSETFTTNANAKLSNSTILFNVVDIFRTLQKNNETENHTQFLTSDVPLSTFFLNYLPNWNHTTKREKKIESLLYSEITTTEPFLPNHSSKEIYLQNTAQATERPMNRVSRIALYRTDDSTTTSPVDDSPTSATNTLLWNANLSSNIPSHTSSSTNATALPPVPWTANSNTLLNTSTDIVLLGKQAADTASSEDEILGLHINI